MPDMAAPRANGHPGGESDPRSGFLALACSRPVVIRALKVTAFVGTVLALINHGDEALAETLSGRSLAQILLTYLVPYCVSVWSSVRTLQAGAVEPGPTAGPGNDR
jgi:hypothetical protein